MARHPNAQLLYDYLAENEANLVAIRTGKRRQEAYKNSFLADDCVGFYPGRSHLAGWFRDGTFMTKWGAEMGQYKATFEVVDILGSDDRAVGIMKERLEAKDGRSVDFTRVAVYRIVDRKIVEVIIRDDDQEAVDRFIEGR